MVNNLAEEIAKAIERSGYHAPHDEKPGEKSGEVHTVKKFMKSCPTCGMENKEYEPAKAFCKSCGVPLGSEADATAAGKCWNCGSDEAEIRA